MEIARPEYLQKLIGSRNNGLIKVVTGLHKCGKTYLMKELYSA